VPIAGSLSHDLDRVVLDDGVRQEVAGDFVELGLIGRVGEFDLDGFPDANPADGVQAEVFHGLGGGCALWVEHGRFRQHGDDSFHPGRISCPWLADKRIYVLRR